MDCSVFQPICDSILGWWNDPLWFWLGWYLVIVSGLALVHWLIAMARPLTGPAILALTFGLFAYFRGRRDQKQKQRTVQDRTRQQEQQWPNPFDWWKK